MVWMTSEELILALAKRFKKIRVVKKVSQKQLASMCNVSYASLKRFEQTGEISLHSLAKLCIGLDMYDEINNIFSKSPYRDIKEVLQFER